MRLPEFSPRITYEAREDLAKDGASQLPRAISTDGDNDDDDERRVSCTNVSLLRGAMKRRIFHSPGLKSPLKRVAGVR